MKTKSKILMSIVAIILSTVLLFIAVSALFNSKTTPDVELNARTVKVEQLTYGEHIESLVDQFDSYTTDNTENSISFNGTIISSLSELYGINNLSENSEKIEKKISTNYNYLTNEFVLEVNIYQDGILIDSLSQEADPLYDSEKDEGYIEYEGERIYLSDCLDIDVLNDCVAVVDDIAIGALVASALLITIVVTSPSVQQTITTTVTQVVETVVSAVKSFWRWLTRWVTKTFTRTVTTTTTVTTYTPTLTISNVKYETKKVTLTELKKYPVGKYCLCFVSGGIIYISVSTISDVIATSILMSAIVVNDKNTGKKMIASTFTQLESDAYRVALAAGLNSRTPLGSPDFDHGAWHYHSRAEAYYDGKYSIIPLIHFF